MTMKRKLLAAFLAIALLPLLLLGVLSTVIAQGSLRDSVGANFEGIAITKAEAIAHIMDERVHEARMLAAQPALLQAVADANAGYADLDEDAAIAGVRSADEAWMAAGKQTPLADERLSNALASDLLRYRDLSPQRYGEIFVTDRLGAAVAMTSRLTDYYQADEEWWSETVAGGPQGLFIDDRGHDESVDALITGVAVPVVDAADRVIGVLKINYEVRGILDIVTPTDQDLSDRVILVRGDGQVVVDSFTPGIELNSAQRALLQPDNSAPWIETTRATTPTLVSQALVSTPIHNRVPSSGAVKGVRGERWEQRDWHVLVEGTQRTAYASLSKLRWLALGVGAVMAVVVAFIAIQLASSISSPLQRLQRGTEIVGSGDLGHRVSMQRSDEIGALSTAFDDMVQRLRDTLASRDELDHEVRERRHAEVQLRQALDELGRSNDDLERFAYVASHDLQEPLRMVTSYLGLVECRYADQLDSDGKEFIDFAVDGAQRMRALIESLLLYSRVDQVGGTFEVASCEQVLAQVIDDLRLNIASSGASITNDPLPDAEIDPNQFRQLLQNLIANALKFRGEQPPAVHITARRLEPVAAEAPLRAGAPGWMFSVHDNGIGLEPHYADRIFVIFQRLHQREAYEGTGIGLTICKRIVERRGGRIWVESSLGEGASFHFTVPDYKPAELERMPPSVESVSRSSPTAASSSA
jgi:signal transduction histidine kinase